MLPPAPPPPPPSFSVPALAAVPFAVIVAAPLRKPARIMTMPPPAPPALARPVLLLRLPEPPPPPITTRLIDPGNATPGRPPIGVSASQLFPPSPPAPPFAPPPPPEFWSFALGLASVPPPPAFP